MPGIAGIIGKGSPERIRQEVGLMVKSMTHEPHYSTGQYFVDELDLGEGWVCRKGEFSDCMPLVSAIDDVVLIFHGENFLDQTSTKQLRARGGVVNARYLLDLYRESGAEFFTKLNGWYAGVIADLRNRKVILFNDRFAMSRVYCHEGQGEFLFASEAKAILKVRPELRKLDPEGVADHLRYNCVTRDRSLFQGISTLPHASILEFENGELKRRRRYFQFSEWEQQSKLPPEEFFERFADTIEAVFPSYSEDSAEVAMSLTAGLDTRLIMGVLGERNRHHPSYTFGGSWGELFDIRTARKLTTVYDQPFESIRINGAFLKNFPAYSRRTVYMSDGAHDAFGAHDLFFNEIARSIAPIRLTGKFGSEVVRIRNLVPSLRYPSEFLQPTFRPLLEKLPTFRQLNPSGNHLTRVVTEEIPWHEFGKVAIEHSQVVLRTPYMDNALVQLMYRAPEITRTAGRLQERYLKARSPEFSTFITNMGRLAPGGAISREILYPMLWALFKMEYIYLYATPHWMTRVDRSLGSLRLERLFSGRQKWEGYRLWIHTDFSDFVRDTLTGSQVRYGDYFSRPVVEDMVRKHVAGTHNYLNEIGRVLSIELIISELLGTSATSDSSAKAYTVEI